LIALDFLHRYCEITHTDIKPENILIQLNSEEINSIKQFSYFQQQN